MRNQYPRLPHHESCLCEDCELSRIAPVHREYNTKTLSMTLISIEWTGGLWLVHYRVKSKISRMIALARGWSYIDRDATMPLKDWNKASSNWHNPAYRKEHEAK